MRLKRPFSKTGVPAKGTVVLNPTLSVQGSKADPVRDAQTHRGERLQRTGDHRWTKPGLPRSAFCRDELAASRKPRSWRRSQLQCITMTRRARQLPRAAVPLEERASAHGARAFQHEQTAPPSFIRDPLRRTRRATRKRSSSARGSSGDVARCLLGFGWPCARQGNRRPHCGVPTRRSAARRSAAARAQRHVSRAPVCSLLTSGARAGAALDDRSDGPSEE